MLQKFKELARRTFTPIHLAVGDSLILTYRDDISPNRVLVEKKFDTTFEPMTINEALIFEAEFEGRRAIGILALEQEK